MKKFLALLTVFILFLEVVEARSFTYSRENKGTVVPIIGNERCKVYYPFSPAPPSLTVKFDKTQPHCNNGLAVNFKAKITFFSNGKEDSHATASFNYIWDDGAPLGAPYGKAYIWKFSDGEIWKGSLGKWKKIRSSNKTISQRESEEKRQQRIENRKNRIFRANIEVGDATKRGLIIEIKGKLVKIQTNDSQCSQRNYDGDCVNYINATVEKWYKRNEIYPRN